MKLSCPYSIASKDSMSVASSWRSQSSPTTSLLLVETPNHHQTTLMINLRLPVTAMHPSHLSSELCSCALDSTWRFRIVRRHSPESGNGIAVSNRLHAPDLVNDRQFKLHT